MKTLILSLSALVFLLLISCARGYEPIDYGKEACAHCRMTIVDDRYAAEMITGKGRAYKFDDVICMKQFMAVQPADDKALIYVEDYLKQEAGAIDAKSAIYLQHDFFSSPMNGNYGAFMTETDAQGLRDSLRLRPMKWEEIK